MSGSKPATSTQPGDKKANGILSYIMAPFSHAIIGNAKKNYSRGEKEPNEDNNPIMAIACMCYPAAKVGNRDWISE